MRAEGAESGGRSSRRHPVVALLVAVLLAVPAVAALTAFAAPPDLLAVVPQGATPEGRERILVRPATGAGRDVAALAEAVGAVEVGAIPPLQIRVLEVAAGNADDALRRLRRSPAVEFAERDAPVRMLARLPNDELYSYQWAPGLVGAPEAWSTTVGASDVVVAVLDTGVDATHEDLQGAVSGGANFVDPTAGTGDDNGHGTLTAGVAAARTDNVIGVAGFCWLCTIMPVKVLDETGQGSLSSVASGIVYATDEGADVINMSFGAPDTSLTLRSAVTYAEERGVLQVAAAGNGGTTQQMYPAAYPEVVGVAGIDQLSTRYSWSSYGGWVSLAAPGCSPSTDLDPTQVYAWYCGTSSAAPVVAGAAGLAFALEPRPAHTTVRDALLSTADPIGDIVAYGRVDLDGAIGAVAASSVSSPSPSPSSDPALLPDPDADPSPEPTTAPGTDVTRLAGLDRYGTAVDVSSATFSEGVPTAYLATGATFPDALAAGAAAASQHVPVLLTPPDVLPDVVADELRRLAPDRLVIVGGTDAITVPVASRAAEVSGAATTRVAGADRYDTAAAVARGVFGTRTSVVYVATGQAFPDALAGVPAAAKAGAPMLLTLPDALPAPTRRFLEDARPDHIVVLGGEQAVSRAVVDELGTLAGEVVRVAGTDRYETAAAIVARSFPTQAAAGFIATGETFPDALAGGPAASVRGAPILLVTRDAVPPPTDQELRRLAPDTLFVLGGEVAVSQATAQDAAQSASEGDPS